MSASTKKSVKISVGNSAYPGRFKVYATIGGVTATKDVIIPIPPNSMFAFVSADMPAYVHNPQPPTPIGYWTFLNQQMSVFIRY